MGADLLENTPVTGFEFANGKITKVKTNGEDFEAEHVVLAAGALTPYIARDLKLNIPIQPARGYSLTMSATKKMPSHAFEPLANAKLPSPEWMEFFVSRAALK